MSESECLLGGKVVIQQLPAFEAPIGEGGPQLKRLLLPKGELAQIHDSAMPIHYMAWLQLRPGAVRGNHYHHVKEEHVYVVSGSIQLTVSDLGTGETVTRRVETGALIRIEPRVAHAFEPLTEGQAIEFSPDRFDAKDTFPWQPRNK